METAGPEGIETGQQFAERIGLMLDRGAEDALAHDRVSGESLTN
jgi:hypothetical protein